MARPYRQPRPRSSARSQTSQESRLRLRHVLRRIAGSSTRRHVMIERTIVTALTSATFRKTPVVPDVASRCFSRRIMTGQCQR